MSWVSSTTLLARGDILGAIRKLTQANKKGPRFADPLEVWGEALMRQGEVSAAAAKFIGANAFARISLEEGRASGPRRTRATEC